MQADRLSERASAQLLASAAIKRQVAEQCLDSILAAALVITETFRDGGKLLLCGNGGSAADCQHMSSELVHRLNRDVPRRGLPAVALTTDTSFLTGFANDSGYEDVFARQIEALGRPGDALIGISTSGESENVVRAIAAANEAGLRTIALTGNRGRLGNLVDVVVSVPSGDTQRIQEAHLAIEHVLCDLVEQALSGSYSFVRSANGDHL